MVASTSHDDRQILRELARRVRDIADNRQMDDRREVWTRHNDLLPTRPMVLCFPEGCWPQLVSDAHCRCHDPQLRRWELQLRSALFTHEQLCDDQVAQPWFDLPWRLEVGDYGVNVPYTFGENRGSYVWDAPIKNLERDFDKLHFRELYVDREGTQRDLQRANDLFGDLLPARLHWRPWWTVGMTWEAAKIIGLEGLMLAMMDQPQDVHRLMAFLRDDHLHFLEWFEREELLTHNNTADNIGSGGIGFTSQLPGDDASNEPAQLDQLWGFAESQETVGISPQMFDEFVLPYQVPLMEKFGLNYYGCCEELEQRIDLVLEHVPRLRRVSVSPKADQRALADKLGGRYVYCRKADPVPVCVEFNEDLIRADIRHTLDASGGSPLDIILKDTHTVQHEPWRLARWVRIVREEVDRYMQGPRS